MWITAIPGANPLWEGELAPVQGGQSVGEHVYRDSSSTPPLSSESPGVVSIGKPQVLPVASLYEAGALPPGVKAKLEQADYFLVQLSCSFRPERDDAIDWARFSVSLNSTKPGEVFAAELHPLSVEMKAKRKVKVGISSSLKFADAAEVGVEYGSGVEYPELSPIITAAGVGESRPSWDYTKMRGWQITGSKLMNMIVRSPKGTSRLTASLAIMAEVNARRFAILFEPETCGNELEVQLWPPPR
jgi:hypothetical protein